jgi:acyl carrier protein phosphodiesterase
MNYLAHAVLSFNYEEILVGNIISDFVKGKSQYDYPKKIQKGIYLHRLIDSYTDSHPVTTKARNFFKPQYRLYSGVFIDVIYDHFLALDENQFANYGGLGPFSELVYKYLSDYESIFPLQFKRIFPYMKLHNWLFNYQFKRGIQRSFEGIAMRAKYLTESDIAFEIFNKYYDLLRDCYLDFFPDVIKFAYENLEKPETF